MRRIHTMMTLLMLTTACGAGDVYDHRLVEARISSGSASASYEVEYDSNGMPQRIEADYGDETYLYRFRVDTGSQDHIDAVEVVHEGDLLYQYRFDYQEGVLERTAVRDDRGQYIVRIEYSYEDGRLERTFSDDETSFWHYRDNALSSVQFDYRGGQDLYDLRRNDAGLPWVLNLGLEPVAEFSYDAEGRVDRVNAADASFDIFYGVEGMVSRIDIEEPGFSDVVIEYTYEEGPTKLEVVRPSIPYNFLFDAEGRPENEVDPFFAPTETVFDELF